MIQPAPAFCVESLEARQLLSVTVTPAKHYRPPAVVLPKPAHVLIVMEENHSYDEIFKKTRAPAMPYFTTLAQNGAIFTDSNSITHPSQPNYLALFAGSTLGVQDDSYVTPKLRNPNLGQELIAAGDTFAGYSEDQPSVGYTGYESGNYAKKHNPWSSFRNVPASDNLPLTYFPKAGAYGSLPTVSFVVPNQLDDMHSDTVQRADTWLQNNIAAYAAWAMSNNSLLIVTWDEGDGDSHIPTIFYGPMVKPGTYGETINHYNVLRTVEQMYGLSYAGQSAVATPISDVWTSAAVASASQVSGVIPVSAMFSQVRVADRHFMLDEVDEKVTG